MKGLIYKLKSDKTDKVYIGSTVRTLDDRFKQHYSHYNSFTNNGKCHYMSAFELIKLGCVIELIEEFEYETLGELHNRESKFIRELGDKAVNIRVDDRTKGERNHRYWEKNKDKVKEAQKKKFECECGSMVRVSDKSRHLKSKKHTALMR